VPLFLSQPGIARPPTLTDPACHRIEMQPQSHDIAHAVYTAAAPSSSTMPALLPQNPQAPRLAQRAAALALGTFAATCLAVGVSGLCGQSGPLLHGAGPRLVSLSAAVSAKLGYTRQVSAGPGTARAQARRWARSQPRTPRTMPGDASAVSLDPLQRVPWEIPVDGALRRLLTAPIAWASAAAVGLGALGLLAWAHVLKATTGRGDMEQHYTRKAHEVGPEVGFRPLGPKPHKTIYLVRHGETEMNLWTGSTAEMWSELRDPGLFDTVLTARGLRQARQLADQVRTLDSIPEVIISSPLTRALQTTDVGFRSVHPNVPVEVDARISERVWHCADYGTDPTVLEERFPGVAGLDKLPELWWWRDSLDPHPRARNSTIEPPDSFLARLDSFLADLAARDEETIAVVAHWGVCIALTGCSLENCQIVETRLGDLVPRADTGLTDFD